MEKKTALPPRLMRSDEKTKITLYVPREIGLLYRMGKQNGHDTPQMSRVALEELFRSYADVLKRPADCEDQGLAEQSA